MSCRAHEEAIEVERRRWYHTATWRSGWYGRPDRFLENLRVVTGCLLLGERVAVVSATREAMWATRKRYLDSRLFELLTIKRTIHGTDGTSTYELTCGGVLQFRAMPPRPMQGFEGQVILQEYPL